MDLKHTKFREKKHPSKVPAFLIRIQAFRHGLDITRLQWAVGPFSWPLQPPCTIKGEPRRFDGIDILVGKVMTAEASEFWEDFGLQID